MDPDAVMRDWYNTTAPDEVPRATASWDHVFACWRSVELDFHTRYGVDFADGTLHRRTWRWFSARVADLLGDNNSRLAQAVRPLIATGGARV